MGAALEVGADLAGGALVALGEVGVVDAVGEESAAVGNIKTLYIKEQLL